MGDDAASRLADVPAKASNFDEVYMQRRMVFADSLKDLKSLRTQLYSAAEHFELSYSKDDHKQIVVESAKDYITKALVSTVDHLGSVAFKLNSFLDERVDEASTTKLQFSSMEQRLQTCRFFTDLNGLFQHSLVIETPKHHKRYIVPAGKGVGAVGSNLSGSGNLCPQQNSRQSKHDDSIAKVFLQPTTVKTHRTVFSKGHSRVPSSSETSPNPLTFSFTRVASKNENAKSARRSLSPFRFPLQRSGSVASRSTSPSSFNSRQRCPSEPRRSIMTCINPPTKGSKEIELYSKKSKHFFKALLSMHRSKKGLPAVPYKYRDDK